MGYPVLERFCFGLTGTEDERVKARLTDNRGSLLTAPCIEDVTSSYVLFSKASNSLSAIDYPKGLAYIIPYEPRLTLLINDRPDICLAVIIEYRHIVHFYFSFVVVCVFSGWSVLL